MPLGFGKYIIVGCLMPLLQEWLWQRFELPPMGRWQRVLYGALTLVGLTAVYGYENGWSELLRSMRDLPDLWPVLLGLGAYFVADHLFLLPYEPLHRDPNDVTHRP